MDTVININAVGQFHFINLRQIGISRCVLGGRKRVAVSCVAEDVMFAVRRVEGRANRCVACDIGGIYDVAALDAAKSDISKCISLAVVFSMDTVININAVGQFHFVNLR